MAEVIYPVPHLDFWNTVSLQEVTMDAGKVLDILGVKNIQHFLILLLEYFFQDCQLAEVSEKV